MNTKKIDITRRELKEVLEYDENTGVFRWKVANNNRVKVGGLAGCLDSNNYLCITYRSKKYYAHRLAWSYVYGKFPKGLIDHIDGNPSNSAITNLRECSYAENQRNYKIPVTNKSGFKGVHWNKITEMWIASARISGGKKTLGSYSTPEEASKVYNDFTKAHYGEFYRDTTGASQ